MNRLSSLLISLLISVSGFSQDKILGILGSSTAFGNGASPIDSSWVRRVNEFYKQTTNVIDTTYNLAVGGQNPYHGMPSSYTPPVGRPGPDDDNNITFLSTFDPDVIIVSYPSNNFDTYTFEEIKTTLTTIKDSANKAGIVCFITTSQPRTGFSALNRQKLKDIKDSIIKWFGSFSINFFDPIVNPADLTIHPDYRVVGDDIHVNNAGHRKLYEQVLAKDIFSAVLAVRLSNFNVIHSSGNIEISWKAYSEESFTKYFIERSRDGRDFQSIHTIDARGLNETNYEYVYKDGVKGKLYFRLRVEEDQRKFYSSVVSVVNETSLKRLRVYQVAAHQIVTELNEVESANVTIEIYTTSGQLALKQYQRVNAGTSKLIIHCPQLKAGLYYVRLSGNPDTTTKLLLK